MEQLPPLAAPSGAPIRLLQVTDLHHFGLAEGHTSFTGPRVTVPIDAFTAGDELSAEQTPGNYSVRASFDSHVACSWWAYFDTGCF